MKLMQVKYMLPVALVLVLVAVLMVYLSYSNRSYHYFLVTQAEGIEAGTPVLLENIPAGAVVGVSDLSDHQKLVEFSLSKEFSIPSNSEIRTGNSGEDNGVQIKIVIMASKDYLNPGDTIFLNSRAQTTPTVVKESETEKEDSRELVYRIQVLASEAMYDPDAAVFKGVDGVLRIDEDGYHKYYFGEEPSLKRAGKLKKKMIEKGFKDAFIVPFQDGERISIDRAIKIEN